VTRDAVLISCLGEGAAGVLARWGPGRE